MLREHDRPGLANIGLIDMVARYALDAGYHVIADGIFGSDRYGEMLQGLTDDHAGVSRYYYFDIGVDETLRRHRSKEASAVSPDMLRSWYRPRDLLGFVDESIITADEGEEQIVSRLVREVGFCDPPICARLDAAVHLQ